MDGVGEVPLSAVRMGWARVLVSGRTDGRGGRLDDGDCILMEGWMRR